MRTLISILLLFAPILSGGDVTVVTGRGVAASGLPATDNFNRADGPLGANWTVQVGSSMAIVGNEVKTTTTGADQFAFWNAHSFNANQYSKVKVVLNADRSMAMARVSGVGTANGYWVRKDGIHKHVAGSYTQLLADDAAALSAGSVLEIRVSGFTISRYIDGVLDGQVTDPGSSLATGSPGIGQWYASGSNPFLDDWEGGNL